MSPRPTTAVRRGGRSAAALVPPRLRRAAAVVTVPVLVAVLALVGRGVPTTTLDLDDGGVWLTATDLGRLGRWNVPVEDLDGGLVATGTAFDVRQDGAAVLLLEPTGPAVVDPATVTVVASATAPGADVSLGGGTVAVVGTDGGLWVRTPATLGGLDTATTPVDADLGDGGRAVATASGAVLAVTGDGTLLGGDAPAVDAPAGAWVRVAAAADPLADLPGTAAPRGVDALTAVGDVPVALSGSTLRTPAGAVALEGDGLVLQQPGPAAATVLVASRTALLEVDLGSLTATPLPGALSADLAATGGGTPSAPVRVAGCAHGAWVGAAGTGTAVRRCPGQDPQVAPLEGVGAGTDLVFRVNRSQVVLNDTRAGRLWLPGQDAAVRTPDWLRAVPEEDDGDADGEAQGDLRTPVDEAECTAEAAPPQAVDDDLPVRAGRTSVLPVLDNDVASACGLLVVTEVEALPAALGVLVPVDGGRRLQVAVPPGAHGSAEVLYTVSDGLGTSAPSTATLRVTVVPEDADTAPVQHGRAHLVVEEGGEASRDVLAGFHDADGDALQLVAATSEDPALTVRTDPGGRVTVAAAPGAPAGTVPVALQVSDGTSVADGVLDVEVRGAGTVGPALQTLLVRAFVDEPVVVEPLAALTRRPAGEPRLAAVADVPGVALTTDLVGGRFTARAARAGTYYVTVTVAVGSAQADGLVRLDVVARPAQDEAPVAAPDVALVPPLGSVTLDPLVNDVDPDGGVLVLRSVAVPAGAPLDVQVLEHHLVRVGLTGDLRVPVRLTYEVSDGTTASTGEIWVRQLPVQAASRPPVVAPVTVDVRTGGVVTVPVLEHATDPDGDALALEPVLAEPLPDGDGLLFVAGGTLRYQAPDHALTTHATFTVTDRTHRVSGRVTVVVHASDPATKAPPRPLDLTARVFAGESVRIPVPLVGIDPDGDGVTLLGADGVPARGSVTAVGPDWLEYEAFVDAAGTDTFSYAVEDWVGQRAVGTVRVGVTGRPPGAADVHARPDDVVVRPGQRVEVRVLANDADSGGSELTLLPTLVLTDDATHAAPPDATAEVVGSRVVVTTPPRDTVLHVGYTADNGRGGRRGGVLTVTVRADAPVLPPVARDVVVPAADTRDRTEVAVDVLAVAANPSGPMEDLRVTVPASVAGVARVDASGRVVVTLVDHAQTVPFLLTNTAAPTGTPGSWAFVTVPALGFFPPTPRPRAPALRVAEGGTLTIDLDEQVQVAPGRRPSVARTGTVQASRAAAPPTGNGRTVTYTPEPGYAGPASVSVPVTDATGPDDPGARTATVTLLVTVHAVADHPPTFVPDPLDVAVGADAEEVDLTAWVHGPAGVDDAAQGWTFTLAETAPTGFSASVVGGDRLRFAAAAGTPRGTSARLSLLLGYGRAGSLPVQVELRAIASIQRTARVADRTVTAVAGRAVDVDVLAGAYDPFPTTPLTVVGVAVDDPAAGTARTDGTTVTVTPAPVGSGTVVVRVRVRDATGDPQREVAATVTVVVRDRPDAPGQPAVVEERDGAVVLAWTPPDAHGDPVTAYRVVAQPGGAEQSCAGTTCTVTGLTNGQAYTFTVAARNGVDWSAPSAPSAPAHPDAVPGTPGTPVAVRGDGSLVVEWAAAPSTGSPVSGYAVEVSPAPASGAATTTVTGTRVTLPRLTNGTAYAVRVRATNAAPAPGPWSAWSVPVAPAGVPAAPAVTATRQESAADGAARVDVTWTAPAGNGDDALTYQVRVDGGAPVDVGTALSWTLADAERGHAYAVDVRARNVAGTGPWGGATGETWSAPGAPVAGTGSAVEPAGGVAWGQGAARWGWSAPASAGGTSLALARYEVEGCVAASATATSCTLAGLVAGPVDAPRVRAVNDRGLAGPWTVLPGVTVRTAPAPATVEVRPGAVDEVTVTVTDGADGGSPATGRRYRVDGGTWHDGRPPASVTAPDGAATVTVEVAVTNALGTTTSSGSGAPTRAAVPDARDVAATASTRASGPGRTTTRFVLTWTDGGTGGVPVDAYEYRVTGPDGTGSTTELARRTVDGRTTTATVDLADVPPGSTVLVEVRARNAVGWSAWPARGTEVLVPAVP